MPVFRRNVSCCKSDVSKLFPRLATLFTKRKKHTTTNNVPCNDPTDSTQANQTHLSMARLASSI